MSDTRLRCVVVVCGEPEPAVQAEHGDFGRWFVRALGAEAATRVIDVRATPASPAWLDDCDALVVSGSPHAVFEPHPWLPPLEELLRDAVCTRALPTLGVCFGHQLVAQALGGRVGRNPRTGTTVQVEAKRVPFFRAGKEIRQKLNGGRDD